MKNVVFWDIKTRFILHRRHIMSLLQSPASSCHVRFEVFTAVTMKDALFWDMALVRTDVLEERITSIIRMRRISKLGTVLAVSSIQSTV
jgi:hypothetical protein